MYSSQQPCNPFTDWENGVGKESCEKKVDEEAKYWQSNFLYSHFSPQDSICLAIDLTGTDSFLTIWNDMM